MAWRDSLVPMLRAFIGDDGDTQKYTDEKLENALVYAALRVSSTVQFPIDYVADIDNFEITPDPTSGATRDDNFINLITAQAACMNDRGAASKAAGQSIRIKDGSSEIDLKGTFASYYNLLKSAGWCEVYEKMKEEYTLSQGSVTVGAAILSPFGLGGGSRYRRI